MIMRMFQNTQVFKDTKQAGEEAAILYQHVSAVAKKVGPKALMVQKEGDGASRFKKQKQKQATMKYRKSAFYRLASRIHQRWLQKD